MSITFTAIGTLGTALLAGDREPDTACLCAQGAGSWDMYLEGADLAELAACASADCPICGGTGVEPGFARELTLNLSNWNARALLGLLGLTGEHGTVGLPEARRAVMRARATFERRAAQLVGGSHLGPLGEALCAEGVRVVHEGNVARILRGPQVITNELDADGLAERLERFAAFVETAGAMGATELRWG